MRKILVVLLVITTLLLSACSPEGGPLSGKKNQQENEIEKVIDVESYIATPKELTTQSTYIGTVVPKDRVAIVPTSAGVVESILVIEGEKVTVGQVLFEINDDIAQNSLDRAEVAYDQTKKSKDQALGAKVELEDYNYNATISGLNDSISSLETTKTNLKNANTALTASVAAREAALDVKYPNEGEDEAREIYINATAYANEYEIVKLNDPDGSTGVLISASTSPGASDIWNSMQAERYPISADDITALGLSEIKADLDEYDDIASDEAQIITNTAQISEINSSIDGLEDQKDSTTDIKELTDKMNNETAAIFNQQLRSAQIGIEAAEIALEGYTITSPINGTIETINVTEDEMVSQASYSILVSDKSHMIVQFYVSKKVRDSFSLDDEVEINLGSETRKGMISQIGVVKNAQKGLYKIEAKILGNTDVFLSDVSVDVTATTLRDNGGLAVPYDSVYFSGDKAYVFAIENGVAIKKYVETGSFNDNEILITSGIDNGDEIICSWAPNLENGSLVSAK